MNILILHRVPYFKIAYDRGIDHTRHHVTYLGTRQALDTLPPGLTCEKAERPGVRDTLTEARAWLAAQGPRRFDRIISMSEYELLDAAGLREELGVPGPPVAQVALARDKVLMKEAVARAGLRVPRFLPARDFLDHAAGGRVPWQGRTVLKPHRGASSEGVLVLDTPAAAAQALTGRTTGVPALDDPAAPALDDFQAEEFLTGPIRHYDGLVQGGKVLLLTASQYVNTCLAYAQGSPMGSFQIRHTPEVHDWVSRVLAAVRIEDGSFHLEAIVHDGETVFLEVGNRVGGADVVAATEHATGVHLPSQELRILLGEPVALPAEPAGDGRFYGWFVVPGHHLAHHRYEGLTGADAHRTDARTVTWHQLPPGAPLPGHITYQAGETVLAGIAAGDTPEDTHDYLTGLFASVAVRSSRVPAEAGQVGA